MTIFRKGKVIDLRLHEGKIIQQIYHIGKKYLAERLSSAAIAAIKAAFGAEEGIAVISATNGYLNAIAATDPQRAQQLANFINEDPLLVCSLVETSKTRWLVGDGMAYILTNVEVRTTIGFNAYAVSRRIGTNTFVYGGNTSGRLGISYYNGEYNYVLHYNSTYHIKSNYPAQSVPHLFSHNVQNGKFFIDGQQYDSWTWSSNPSGVTFGIFAVNTGAEIAMADIQFVEFVDNQTNEQVAHFVPFHRNGESGMLDILSGTFYPNANTAGSFTIQLTDKEK